MRFKLGVQFQGTPFSGWQVQPGQRTVQGEIEKAIETVISTKVSVIASGRTDAGVHANFQVAHVDVPGGTSERTFLRNVNALLPEQIRILKAEPCDDDFHARKNAKFKTYRYLIEEAPVLRPHFRDYVHYRFARTDCPPESPEFQKYRPLDLDSMNKACENFLGTHDFTSFRARGAAEGPTEKTILSAFWGESEISETSGRVLLFEITGDGFLKQMVRNIVGTLMEVGEGKRAPEEISHILNSKDRSLAGPTAPAKGLMLHTVFYDKPPQT